MALTGAGQAGFMSRRVFRGELLCRDNLEFGPEEACGSLQQCGKGSRCLRRRNLAGVGQAAGQGGLDSSFGSGA